MGKASDLPIQGKGSSRPSGKKPKHFLEKKDALELAASISDVQEAKSTKKAEKHHKPQAGQSTKDDKGTKASTSKIKIKETKALLAAQRARAKKDKAKKRRRLSQGGTSHNDGDQAVPPGGEPLKAVRKRVSFA